MAISKKSNKKAGPKTTEDVVAEESQFLGDDVTLDIAEDGSVLVELDIEEVSEGLGAFSNDLDETNFYRNLTDELSENDLNELGSEILRDIESDEGDRAEWLRTIDSGLDLLGLGIQEKTVPFEGACSAQHPLIMEAAIKFQSKASNELLPADGPVKTKVLGDSTEEKEKRANRIKHHMNYQLTEEMTEFYTDSERLLLYVPLVGSGFKKSYYDSHLERPVSEFVPADQMLVPNQASDLHRCSRYTHILYKSAYDFDADCLAGLYNKPDDFGEPTQPKLTDVQRKTNSLIGVEIGVGDNSAVYTLYEQHVERYIESLDPYENDPDQEYTLSSPYIVTVEANSGAVVGIRRNWKEGDKKRKKKVQFAHYTFVPGFGFYGFGYLHLLGNLQLTLTSSLRSLVDAGQFANLQGGFKLKGVRIVDDGTPIVPGQFKDLEAMTQDIHKAIMPLPFKEPSHVLYQMLEFLDIKGQKFADSTEQVIADATNYGPVGTTMALLDASTKFFSAVHKRLHKALKQELQNIARINSETLADDTSYNIENESMSISRADYSDIVDVVPVSDPNISSNAHRMTKAQTLFQLAQQAPDIHDMREVMKHVYINMDYPNIDKILPEPEEAVNQDPVSDIQAATEGKAIKAFEGQDHKAHIALKQAFIQDPMSGGNAMMQKASIQLQANIQEHMMLGFVEQLRAQQQMQGVPEAEAASQIAQMNQKKLQMEQEQAKGGQDDAAMLLAQAEMMDSQTEAMKAENDAQFRLTELSLQKEKIDLDILKEMRRSDEFDKKQAADIDKLVTTKGIDAMINSLSQKVASDATAKEESKKKDVDKKE